MADLSPEQIDAVLAHLSDEYDAAEQAARSKDYGWWNGGMADQIGGAIKASKADNMRALRAAADRHPERFASLALGAEKDLRDLAGYSQAATVESVLRATAKATVDEVAKDAAAAVQTVGDVAGFGLGVVWKAIPLPLKVLGGLALAGVVYVYARPFGGRST